MSSRFYTPLEEEANDPSFDEASPFEGAPGAYDTPESGDSPFTPPPSVRDTKATKPVEQNPFDQPDPRIKALDDELSGRPRSLAGIVAAFSPSGDKRMAALLAQRHMYGQERHGDMALQGSMARQNAALENALKKQEMISAERESAARMAAEARTGSAGINAGSRENVATIHTGRPFPVAAGASVYDPKTGENSAQNAFKPPAPPRPSAGPAAGRAPVDPQVPVLQAELKQLSKAINDPALQEDQKLPLMRKYNLRRQQLQQLTGQGAPAPSAAPSTAPSVQSSGKPTATGPNGEKIEWDGTAWVPAS